jgi:negative regulator of flagellin synthesis FlgM
MTDKIANQARILQSSDVMRNNLDKLKGRQSESVAKESQPARAEKPQSGADSVKLSNLEQKVKDQSSFDRAKVESIKDAIRSGNYPLDPRRIAENFVSLERMIDN